MMLYAVCATRYSITVVDVSEGFRRAVLDYRMLLDRGYPEVALRDLVGNRYRLSQSERATLYRGVCSSDEAVGRAERRAQYDLGGPGPLWVDTLNVLYTLANYLLGRPVFIGTDGWLRDVGEAHGRPIPAGVLQRAVGLLVSHASGLLDSTSEIAVNGRPDCRPVRCVLDAAADITPAVADILAECRAIALSVEQGADQFLVARETGLVATSDSQIIDRCLRPVIDLPRFLLQERFSVAFVELASLL